MKEFLLHSGATMPGLGLGTWQAESGVVGKAIKTAIEIGYRHIDCAFIYGNEAEIGSSLKDVFAGGEVSREDLFFTSKLWNSEHAPEDVEPALRKTLEDLGLEYLDLYLMHWPVAMNKEAKEGENPFLSLEERPLLDTWRAMEACVDKGLVKDIGVSNFSKKKLQDLVKASRIKPSVNQVEMHPYLQMPELMEYCKVQNVHVTAYSPLGSPGRSPEFKGDHEIPILDDATIHEIAKDREVTPAQVILAWALTRGSVIPKSVSESRQKENLASADLELTPEELAKIQGLDEHRRYVDGSFWCGEGFLWTGEGSPYTLANLWDESSTPPEQEL